MISFFRSNHPDFIIGLITLNRQQLKMANLEMRRMYERRSIAQKLYTPQSNNYVCGMNGSRYFVKGVYAKSEDPLDEWYIPEDPCLD